MDRMDRQSVLAAGAVLAVGMLLLGLPGAVFLELVLALGLVRKPAPHSVWPLAIFITMAGRRRLRP